MIRMMGCDMVIYQLINNITINIETLINGYATVIDILLIYDSECLLRSGNFAFVICSNLGQYKVI